MCIVQMSIRVRIRSFKNLDPPSNISRLVFADPGYPPGSSQRLVIVRLFKLLLRLSLNMFDPRYTQSRFVSPRAPGYAKCYSRSHGAVIRVYDVGLPNPRSARAMQNGVRLALLHFLQQLTDFQCGRRNDLDTAPFRLC